MDILLSESVETGIFGITQLPRWRRAGRKTGDCSGCRREHCTEAPPSREVIDH